jgi:hypothetical protein
MHGPRRRRRPHGVVRYPRRAAVKGGVRTSVVRQDSQAKFKGAQAKAAKVGIENLTKEDMDGLNYAQLKQLSVGASIHSRKLCSIFAAAPCAGAFPA